MGPAAVSVVSAAVSAAIGLGIAAVWFAGRRREAARLVRDAETAAASRRQHAERDAESPERKHSSKRAKGRTRSSPMPSGRPMRGAQRNQPVSSRRLGRQDAGARRPPRRHRSRRARPARARDGTAPSSAHARTRRSTAVRAAGRRAQHELQRVAGLTADEARNCCSSRSKATPATTPPTLKRLDAEARETAADRAKQYITEAIQRSAAEHAIETTVSVVDLPSDDLKGASSAARGATSARSRLATGVELIVDDTPGAIILSGFDPYRREIAQQAIERLIADGRIHPARIEEVVEKVKEEIDESDRARKARRSRSNSGLHDLHPEVLRLMGRLKFRTSYGQNVLQSFGARSRVLAGIMAREVGLDAHVAVRAAFLHDIGKAIDREMQGTHLELGSSSCASTARARPCCMAMAAHHMDIDWPSLEAMIVQAADAISAARPGARRDILESYVKRLEKLEGIADSFKGVSKAFALQAGREIRIMVESEKVSDEEAVWLSKDIARRIENELEYPGQIKVTVIRETRAVELPAEYGRAALAGPPPPSPTLGEQADRRDPRAPAARAGLAAGRHRRRCRRRRAGAERLEVLTIDALVEGVHFDRALQFRRSTSAIEALAVNLSATSPRWAPRRGWRCCRWRCRPRCPSPTSTRWSTASLALAGRARVALAGGNLTRSPGPLMVDVTVIGTVKRRAGADARRRAAGRRRCTSRARSVPARAGTCSSLQVLVRLAGRHDRRRDPDLDELRCERYLSPGPARPRSAAARPEPGGVGVHGSQRRTRRRRPPDGGRERRRRRHRRGARCRSSRSARRWFERGGQDAIAAAVTGGDDYELLFAVPAAHAARLAAGRSAARRRAADPHRRTAPRSATSCCVARAARRSTPLAGRVRATFDEPSPDAAASAAGWTSCCTSHDTPERTAAAFALGVFFGFSPFLGLHTVLGLAWRSCSNLNRVAVLLGVYSNLPWIHRRPTTRSRRWWAPRFCGCGSRPGLCTT